VGVPTGAAGRVNAQEGIMVADAVLEIDHISKRYGGLVAVDDLSLEVSAGELVGFVGRNGAGKTTTMRIVLGVLGADAGAVRFHGTPLTFDARRQIGYMPEERGLYPKMRLAEQLSYLGELHGMADADARASALRWLERFGLQDRRDDELQSLATAINSASSLPRPLCSDRMCSFSTSLSRGSTRSQWT